ncbi:DNA modification system-associated small protein [Alkalihalophilus pseudofirmus]|uniref:DNA modification system-associated small protein n=1 Tax=Alkalihalophilus pseudofirmus TaxID=79885 RepID=UPI0034DE92B0
MKEIKKRESELLSSICEKYNLSQDLLNKLLKTSEINSYENKPSRLRKKELIDLINFHSKKQTN